MIRFMFLVILSVFLSSSATAQTGCQTRNTVLSYLKKDHKEAVVAVGLTNDGKLVEFVASNKGKTWTLIVTTPDGISCLITAGQDWTIIRPMPAVVERES